MCSNHIKAH
jgi:hypothetical protein